jgi:hypothetical protein
MPYFDFPVRHPVPEYELSGVNLEKKKRQPDEPNYRFEFS